MVKEYSRLDFINLEFELDSVGIYKRVVELFGGGVVDCVVVDKDFVKIYFLRDLDEGEVEILNDFVSMYKGYNFNVDKVLRVFNDSEVVESVVSSDVEVLFKEYEIFGELSNINLVVNDNDIVVYIYDEDRLLFHFFIKDVIKYFDSELDFVRVDINLDKGEYIVRMKFDDLYINKLVIKFRRGVSGEELFKIKYVNIIYYGD